MDIALVPFIDPIILTGLDFSMKPSHARYEAEQGFIKPFPELKVIHQLKKLALAIYNQEKLIPDYHSNVCSGRNALAYFLTAMHRQQAPQPQTHTRQGSVASTSSGSSSNSCKSTGGKRNCELPKLVTSSMLPLGYWDSLYYAIIAEIRTLYQDLQQRFGFGCETGTYPLHNRGSDGDTNEPFTAIDFASMLETAWYALMDNRLVAALDDAVRMRKMREAAAVEEEKEIRIAAAQMMGKVIAEEPDVPARPPILYGLMDVNDLSPEIITSLLWDKHAPEVDRACSEDFEDESMMTARRAAQHQQQIVESLAVATPLASSVQCTCHAACVCKLKCDQHAAGCTCANVVHIYHLVNEQRKYNDELEVRAKYVKAAETSAQPLLSASSDGSDQLRVADAACLIPEIHGAVSKSSGNIEIIDRTHSVVTRPRTNTADSDLAYVPDSRALHRGIKDAVPLGFYGRASGQRYPNMRPHTPTTSPMDVDEYSYYRVERKTSKSVSRKPVPAPIIAPPVPQMHSYATQGRSNQVPTPPKSSPYAYQTFAAAGQATNPPMPQSQDEVVFTQGSDTNNPFSDEEYLTQEPKSFYQAPLVSQSFPQPNTTTSPYNDSTQKSKSFDQAPRNAADDYISLLPHHPSTTNIEYPSEPFPRLSHAATTSPPKHPHQPLKSRATTFNSNDTPLPTLKSFTRTHIPKKSLDKALPSMPEPDFIAPRPAARQRYVSAGGNAKLSERAEIPGPAFQSTAVSGVASPEQKLLPSGHGISKEELDARLRDPAWIMEHFGTAAAAVVASEFSSATGTPMRSSDESARSSAESKREKEKRDRTSSGASKRERLKRVFSRKGSGYEEE
ncbi:hypothetical protein LTR09_001164 [Extremus antarcticus]|uniref:Uncharacterized protein n=1 Tax=Extremus antarcticus TaxID=702011 RepID=A0AAJ0LWN3_9PEZI|nr:hypothetical protein LTR09_001164 [Extremus antarcticus]